MFVLGDTPGDYIDLKPNNPNIKVEDGTLTINNIQKTNEGYYLCEAVNGIGSGLSAVILISVQGMSYCGQIFLKPWQNYCQDNNEKYHYLTHYLF